MRGRGVKDASISRSSTGSNSKWRVPSAHGTSSASSTGSVEYTVDGHEHANAGLDL